MPAAPFLVFEDPADLEAFLSAVAAHAADPGAVLRIAQGRALHALAAGGLQIAADDLPYVAHRQALDVTQDALVTLAGRCGQTEAMTTAGLVELRAAAMAAYAWQAHVDVQHRAARKQANTSAERKREAGEARTKQAADKRAKALGLLQREADSLRKQHPTMPILDLRAKLRKHPGATGRLVRDVKISRARKNLSGP